MNRLSTGYGLKPNSLSQHFLTLKVPVPSHRKVTSIEGMAVIVLINILRVLSFLSGTKPTEEKMDMKLLTQNRIYSFKYSHGSCLSGLKGKFCLQIKRFYALEFFLSERMALCHPLWSNWSGDLESPTEQTSL